jgi:protein gp37
MPHRTSIEWCDYSSNAIRARDPETGASGHYCEKLSPGCAMCYSSALQTRFKMPAFPGKPRQPSTSVIQGDVVRIRGLEVFLNDKELEHRLKFRPKGPFHGDRPKVFVEDMSDLFGSWVPFEWIDKCFATFAMRPDVDWQVLTKRPERAAEYLSDDPIRRGWLIGKAADEFGGLPTTAGYFGPTREWEFPLPNVHLGTSCENQEQFERRRDHLVMCPAAVRFISFEPLLSNIACGQMLRQIDWAIIGGESGPKARPMDLAWGRSLIEQCRAAGVAPFFKQAGSRPLCNLTTDWDELDIGALAGTVCPSCRKVCFRLGPWQDICQCGAYLHHEGDVCEIKLKDPKGGDLSELPADLRVREFPKATGARRAGKRGTP